VEIRAVGVHAVEEIVRDRARGGMTTAQVIDYTPGTRGQRPDEGTRAIARVALTTEVATLQPERRLIDGALLGLDGGSGLAAVAWWRRHAAGARRPRTVPDDPRLDCRRRFSPRAGQADPARVASAALGRLPGLRGILLATGAGLLTPSGPFVAIPIAAAMGTSGAATGPLVAYERLGTARGPSAVVRDPDLGTRPRSRALGCLLGVARDREPLARAIGRG
jgi:hypothetical protein